MKRLSLAAAFMLTVCAGSAVAQDTAAKPAETQPAPKLVAGARAPQLSIEKWVKGDSITGFEKGRTYVVEFWATWCGPCIAQIPHLTALQAEHKDQGLVVVGVTAMDPNNSLKAVEKMVTAKGELMGYTVAWDEDRSTSDAFMKAAEQRGIPCSFVVDGTGTIAYIGHPMYLDLVIDKVIAGKWDVVKGNEEVAEARKAYGALSRAVDSKDGITAITDFETKYPKLAGLTADLKYFALLSSGDAKAAAEAGNAYYTHLASHKDAQGLNALAWRIVDPEGSITNKDVDLAMKAAKESSRLTNDEDGAILDTLARCHYLKGDKTKAIEIQKKAVAHSEGTMKTELEKVLKEYESGK